MILHLLGTFYTCDVLLYKSRQNEIKWNDAIIPIFTWKVKFQRSQGSLLM